MKIKQGLMIAGGFLLPSIFGCAEKKDKREMYRNETAKVSFVYPKKLRFTYNDGKENGETFTASSFHGKTRSLFSENENAFYDDRCLFCDSAEMAEYELGESVALFNKDSSQAIIRVVENDPVRNNIKILQKTDFSFQTGIDTLKVAF